MANQRNHFSSVLRLGTSYWDVVLVAIASCIAVGYWNSQRPEGQFAQAMEDVERKDWDMVRRRAAALEKSVGYFPHAQLFWGISEIQNDELVHALEDLQAAMQHPATKPLALAYAGEAWYKLGQYTRAEQMLLAAHKEAPNRADTHRWLSALYYDTGAMGHALVHLTTTSELAPADPRPHRLIGLINKDFENYEPAIAAYQESLRRDPRQPDAGVVLLELAEAEVRARQYTNALLTLKRCRPSVQQKVFEAECHFALGASERATSILHEILTKSPDRLDALVLLGGILLEQGKLPEAIRALSHSVEIDPLDYTARYRLSQAHQRMGDESQASKHGKIAEEMKQLREKFADLHHQAIAKPHDAEIRFQLGVAAEKLNRLDLARNWYEAALALDPSHSSAAAALALSKD